MPVETLPISEREVRVGEIHRRAKQWRLMDCTEATLQRMRAAVDQEMREVEDQLAAADAVFMQHLETGDPAGTEQTLEAIDGLSVEWERLRKRLKEIDHVLQERHLRTRVIDLLGSERRIMAVDALVFVSILVVVALTLFEMLVPNLPPSTIDTITVVDTAICFLLLGDFFMRLTLSDHKGWYLRTYWLDFVSSIPFYGILRFGRLVRIARFVRLLRLLRLSRAVRLLLFIFRGLDKLTKTFEINLLKRSVIIAIALLLFGALAIGGLEGSEEQSLRNFGESLWWSFSTVVTGGFADLYNPSTSTGRLVTVGMILLGLTVTGIFTASLTSVLVGDESDRLEQNQRRFEERLQAVNHKLDLLTGETSGALVALEAVAQAVANQPSSQALAEMLAHSLTMEFGSLQASVHRLDAQQGGLVRLAHAGPERLAPPERVPLGDGFVGGAAAAFLARDLTVVDLEPQTQPSTEVQGLVMLCPMVAAQRFLGLLHITLPSTLESDQLYTRVPMTLAHHAAMAFHAADLRGES
jgi:voltage-gated potassium channel